MNRSAGALDMVFVQELIDAVAVGFEEQLDFTQEMNCTITNEMKFWS